MKRKKNLQIIDYQAPPLFHKQVRKRKTTRIALWLIAIIVLGIAAVTTAVYANPNTLSNEHILSPQIVFTGEFESNLQADLLHSQVDMQVNGLIAKVDVTQEFKNPSSVIQSGFYQFPLPENAAVNYLHITIGDRVIEGKIMEKQQAKQVFIKAKAQGKKAGLVQQKRANIFSTDIANIGANERVIVKLTYIQQLTVVDKEVRLFYPLAITSRYQPKGFQPTEFEPLINEVNQPLMNDRELDNQAISDSAQLTMLGTANIDIRLNAGLPIKQVRSDTHRINILPIAEQEHSLAISLQNGITQTNKGFELVWQYEEEEQTGIAFFQQFFAGDYYSLILLMPPKQDAQPYPARDITFIIDTSGSMQGDAIIQAKQALSLAISELLPKDSFNIIAFDDESSLLFPTTQMASVYHKSLAAEFIDKLEADGGTEMYRPLSQALLMSTTQEQVEQAVKQIVFITDGAISNEHELLQLVANNNKQHRLFTVAIGLAPNDYFMRKAAEFGRGSRTQIREQTQVSQRMGELLQSISQPVLTDIEVDLGSDLSAEVFPEVIPDLYQHDPVVMHIKSKQPLSNVQINALKNGQPWQRAKQTQSEEESLGVATLWAKAKINSTLDSLITGAEPQKVKSRVLATALLHQLMSPYTSFVAVEKSQDEGLLQQDKSNMLTRLSAPQTALNWLMKFVIGVLLLLSAFMLNRRIV